VDKVIFVHIPKTAGTSLMTSLREDVGNTFFDYNTTKRWWSPLGKYRCILDSLTRTNISEPVIFGHFLAAKYADASLSGFKKRKGHLYVTFAREPLQRAISHYHYWDRVELPATDCGGNFGKNGGHSIAFFCRVKWRMFSPSFFGEFRSGTSTLSDSQTVTRKAYGSWLKPYPYSATSKVAAKM
jgi:hypothetical protein